MGLKIVWNTVYLNRIMIKGIYSVEFYIINKCHLSIGLVDSCLGYCVKGKTRLEKEKEYKLVLIKIVFLIKMLMMLDILKKLKVVIGFN